MPEPEEDFIPVLFGASARGVNRIAHQCSAAHNPFFGAPAYAGCPMTFIPRRTGSSCCTRFHALAFFLVVIGAFGSA